MKFYNPYCPNCKTKLKYKVVETGYSYSSYSCYDCNIVIQCDANNEIVNEIKRIGQYTVYFLTDHCVVYRCDEYKRDFIELPRLPYSITEEKLKLYLLFS